MFSESKGSGRLPNKCYHNTIILASHSLEVVFLEGLRPRSTTENGQELFVLLLTTPHQWRVPWWAAASTRHMRPEWVGVRLHALLREEPGLVTQIIGQQVTGKCPADFHSPLFLGHCRAVLSYDRSHNILVKVTGHQSGGTVLMWCQSKQMLCETD